MVSVRVRGITVGLSRWIPSDRHDIPSIGPTRKLFHSIPQRCLERKRHVQVATTVCHLDIYVRGFHCHDGSRSNVSKQIL
jgi:hypothetical protein